MGELNQARQGHNMILNDLGEVYVIGGMDPESIDDLYTEICDVDFDCKQQEPVLDGYTYYPELKFVSETYCI